jgi:type I restriction enzyme S subunit
MHGLNSSIVKALLLPLPKKYEQERILNFLDHETAKIDTLIEKQQQLIKLLKEKRQAVISHAVTKGLNPQAPMKNSGVEWLGEVPEHWVLSTPGRVCSVISKGTTPAEQSRHQEGRYSVPFLIVNNILSLGVLNEDNLIFIPDIVHNGMLSRSKVFPGDVLFNIVGPPLGKTGVVSDSFPEWNINQAIAFFRPISVLNTFLRNWLQSEFCNSWFWLHAKKTSGQANLTLEMCRKVPLLIPPEEEQQEIDRYCNHISETIDCLIKKCEDQTELLKERRTALISAAVTGKIDVRNWKAPEQTQTPKEAAA